MEAGPKNIATRDEFHDSLILNKASMLNGYAAHPLNQSDCVGWMQLQ